MSENLNKKEYKEQVKEIIDNLVPTYNGGIELFSREKVIKRCMELDEILWIKMHRDPIEYFESLDDSTLKRALASREHLNANPV